LDVLTDVRQAGRQAGRRAGKGKNTEGFYERPTNAHITNIVAKE